MKLGRTPNEVALMVFAAVAAPLLLSAVVYSLISSLRPPPTWSSYLQVALPNGDIIDVGSEGPYDSGPLVSVSYFRLRWHHDSAMEQFDVWLGHMHADQLRGSEDGARVWLVDSRTSEVWAALDTTTGKYWGEQGSRVPGWRSPYPPWATASGGVLLGEVRK